MTLDHRTAQQWILADREEQLSAENAVHLRDHLADCVECQAYATQIEAMEMQLAHGLKMRWPMPSSAEMLPQKQRLLAAVAPRRRTAFWQLGSLAVGVAGLIVLIGLALTGLRQPSETTPVTTATTTPLIVAILPSPTPTDEPTAVPTATNEPPVAVQPTEKPATATPTATPNPTATPQPLPTEEPTVPPPPTEQPTQIVVQPTETSRPDAEALTHQYIVTRNTGNVGAVRQLMAPDVYYTSREGSLYGDAEAISAELNQFSALQSSFSVSDCYYSENATRMFSSCVLTMQNSWRTALELAPYRGQLLLHFDLDGQIVHHADFQISTSYGVDFDEVKRFQTWLRTAHPEVDALIEPNPMRLIRVVDSAELIAYATEWVNAGKP